MLEPVGEHDSEQRSMMGLSGSTVVGWKNWPVQFASLSREDFAKECRKLGMEPDEVVRLLANAGSGLARMELENEK